MQCANSWRKWTDAPPATNSGPEPKEAPPAIRKQPRCRGCHRAWYSSSGPLKAETGGPQLSLPQPGPPHHHQRDDAHGRAEHQIEAWRELAAGDVDQPDAHERREAAEQGLRHRIRNRQSGRPHARREQFRDQAAEAAEIERVELASGKRRRVVVPCPARELMTSSPPWAAMISRTMDRPRPAPPPLPV